MDLAHTIENWQKLSLEQQLRIRRANISREIG
jgi:hypothetical protein